MLICILTTIFVLFSITSKKGQNRISFAFLYGLSRKDGCDSNTSAEWSRAVNDGHWYVFSRPPLFVFYVYSAFLVDQESHDVIRLISIGHWSCWTSSALFASVTKVSLMSLRSYVDRHDGSPSPEQSRALQSATTSTVVRCRRTDKNAFPLVFAKWLHKM